MNLFYRNFKFFWTKTATFSKNKFRKSEEIIQKLANLFGKGISKFKIFNFTEAVIQIERISLRNGKCSFEFSSKPKQY